MYAARVTLAGAAGIGARRRRRRDEPLEHAATVAVVSDATPAATRRQRDAVIAEVVTGLRAAGSSPTHVQPLDARVQPARVA